MGRVHEGVWVGVAGGGGGDGVVVGDGARGQAPYCLVGHRVQHLANTSQVPQLYCIQLGVQYPKNSKI